MEKTSEIIVKQVYWPLKSIESLLAEKSYKVSLPNFPLDKCVALSKLNENNDLEFKFILDEIYGQEYLEDIQKFGVNEEIILTQSGAQFVINSNSAKYLSVSLSKPQVLTLTVKNFQTSKSESFDDKILRMTMEIDEKAPLSLFQTKLLRISGTTTGQGIIEFELNGTPYHLFGHKNDDLNKNYLFIESRQELKFGKFKSDCDSILIGFGFITGNYYQNKQYIQVLREENIISADNTYYEQKQDSIITNEALLDPLSWWRYLDIQKRPDLIEKVPGEFQMNYFNSLIDNINRNSILSRTIKLLLEGNQTKVIILKAGIYSIALETLTNLIYEENEEKINPIEDKKISQLLQRKFRDTLKEYDSFIGDYGMKILESKINDLNRPTNSKKLLKPFEIYGIPLNKEQELILSHRNKFLHGTAPFNENELDSKEFEITNISLKLLFLISCLILKYCGYSGYILNLSTWHSHGNKKEDNEHIFKLI